MAHILESMQAFSQGFTAPCSCGHVIHGKITITGLSITPSERPTLFTIDTSHAKSHIAYDDGITACPNCGDTLPSGEELDTQERNNAMGGKPSRGTPADKRLAANKPTPATKPTPMVKPATPATPKKGK